MGPGRQVYALWVLITYFYKHIGPNLSDISSLLKSCYSHIDPYI